MEELIVVDNKDNPIGTAEKMDVHRRGLLHRAFSIFVWRHADDPEILLQQRALEKYHSPGLWTNTCCGHPLVHESTQSAAERRLFEEMGFTQPLQEIGVFHYRALLENDLIENEIDHVFVGEYQSQPINPSSAEVGGYQWVKVSDLAKDIQTNPTKYTAWLEKAFQVFQERNR